MRKQYHQLDPKSFARKALEDAPYRQDVRGERYDEKTVYRDRNYPGEYFTWHPFDAEMRKKPGNHGAKGEWRMGAIAGGE